MRKSIEEAKSGKALAVFGLSLWPAALAELAMLREFNPADIHYAFLHCEPEERKRRLIDRGTPHHWKSHQDWYDQFFAAMEKDAQLKIDTTNESVVKTARRVREWLESIRS